jgi:hypothetical protein
MEQSLPLPLLAIHKDASLVHYIFLRIASVENLVFFPAPRNLNFSQESIPLVGVEDVFLVLGRKLELLGVGLSKVMDVFNGNQLNRLNSLFRQCVSPAFEADDTLFLIRVDL